MTRTIAVALLRRVARALGFQLSARDLYSPIPDIPPADATVWTTPSSLAGVELDLDAQLSFAERELSPYVSEFVSQQDVLRATGFQLWNGYYQSVDAELLYAMIRWAKPARVLEIGAGYSTLVTAAAAAHNARDGVPAQVVAIDPDPRIALDEVRDIVEVERLSGRDVPLERFLELQDRDVLFVDSSHAVKLGSEVNYLVLEVLPRLRPGVLVHFHDIFLPFEYPRAWYLRGTYLAEQYLVHAFLVSNRSVEIVLAAAAAARLRRARLESIVPSLRQRSDHVPAAFWLRRESV